VFEDLDLIEYTKDDVWRLQDWKDTNLDLVRNYKVVLDSGVIKITSDITTHYLTFNTYDKVTHIEAKVLYKNRLNDVMTFDFINREDLTCQVFNLKLYDLGKSMLSKKNKNVFDAESGDEYITDVLFVYASTMAYMTYYEKDYIVKEEPKRLSNSQKREIKRRQQSNPRSLISINKRTFTLKSDAKFTNPTKKEIQRVAEAWGVRGHFRLQNGKKVWVKPYAKGKGRKTLKVYALDIK